MMLVLRITREMLNQIRQDLMRQHLFASERVGFAFCRFAAVPRGVLILVHAYMPVADDDYVDDDGFGALIGPNAFRRALECTLDRKLGIFHVHMHAHHGIPSPSDIDVRETAKFVPDFFHVRADVPHGALIASRDGMSGKVWLAESGAPNPITDIYVVGAPLQITRGGV
jgi:hypothetical protein